MSALAGKYRSLAALRQRREELTATGKLELSPAEAALRKAAFRKLAEEFPGCLRELDSLTALQLAARADAVAGDPCAVSW